MGGELAPPLNRDSNDDNHEQDHCQQQNIQDDTPSFSMAHALSMIRKRREDESKAKKEREKELEEEKKRRAREKRRRRRKNLKERRKKLKADSVDDTHSDGRESLVSDPEKLNHQVTNNDYPFNSHKNNSSAGDPCEAECRPVPTVMEPPKANDKCSSSQVERPSAYSQDPPSKRLNLLVPRIILVKNKKTNR